MKAQPIPDALGHVRTRFEYNIKRVRGLIAIYKADKKESKDILRAGVVFLHATLEDALRGMLAWKLPEAPIDSLKGILFNGLFPGTTDRLDKISLAQLRQHANKTVKEVCREAITTHLSRESYNNKEDIGRALLRLGIPVKDFGAMIDKIEPAILRRHEIVHQSDRMPAETDHGKPRSIGSEEVEKWADVVDEFIEKALAFFELDRMKKQGTLIKAVTRKQFSTYNPARSLLAELLIQEKAWYADAAGNVLGTILFDKTDKDWGWVILGRDPKGEFRAIDTGASLDSQVKATAELVKRMAHVSGSGQKVFEQD